MPAAPAEERLAAARAEVRRASELLVDASPEALQSCHGALDRAVSELAGFRSQCAAAPPDAGALSTALGLRSEILRAARLLENLAAFYRGWERILGTMSAGYTARGDAAPVARQGRLYCRG
jgi:hypothetical protein